MSEISDSGVAILFEYSRAKIAANSKDNSKVNGKNTITASLASLTGWSVANRTK